MEDPVKTLFPLLIAYQFIPSHEIYLGLSEQRVLDTVIKEFEENPIDKKFDNIIHLAGADAAILPKIYIWCPMQHFKLQIRCPVHQQAYLRFLKFASCLAEKNHLNPRLVYDISGNVILVQSIYYCHEDMTESQSTGHKYLSASDEIMSGLPAIARQMFPFYIRHRSSFSRLLLSYVLANICQGVTFSGMSEAISSMNYRSFIEQASVSGINSIETLGYDSDNFYNNQMFSFPSHKLLIDLFLNFYVSVRRIISEEMSKHSAIALTCDHTFKASKHIGIKRSWDNSYINQFKNLYIGLNENGEVLCWRLTRSTAFDEVSDLLINLKETLSRKESPLKVIVLDDCCQFADKYKAIFSGVEVKLDLFHAVQRFVKTLSKKDSKSFQISREFGLIFRDDGDFGSVRTKVTPSPEILNKHLNTFLESWNGLLKRESIEAIERLRNHINKGCLSFISPGCGTEENERLHKFLNSLFLCSATVLSPQLALAVLSYSFYAWNKKRKGKKHSCNSSITPIPPIFPNEISDKTNGSSSILVDTHIKTSNGSDMPVTMSSDFQSKGTKPRDSLNYLTLEQALNEWLDSSRDNFSTLLLYYLVPRVLDVYEIISSIHKQRKNRNNDFLQTFFRTMHGPILKPQTSHERYGESTYVLKRNLSNYNLSIDPVLADGNCLFRSLGRQISKLFADKCKTVVIQKLCCHLETYGLGQNEDSNTSLLRMLFVEELQSKTDNYRCWMNKNNTLDFELEVERFMQDGFFASEIGDICCFALCQKIGVSITIITSHVGIIDQHFVPKDIKVPYTFYLAYDHSGPGHYDATQNTSSTGKLN